MQFYPPVLASILFLISATNVSAQIMLSTQAEVDAWDPTITVLTEDVIITGSDITNIDALSGLTDIASNLDIEANPNLTNIDGLAGLVNVSGRVNIQSNNGLTNINGFENLADFTGNIVLQFNDGLQDIGGFSGLTNVSGTLSLWNNEGLTNIDGLNGLTDLTGRVLITGNDVLTSIDGFSGLAGFSGEIELTQNISLTNIDVFAGMTDIPGVLEIKNTSSIANIDVFSTLTDVTGSLILDNMDALTAVDALSGLADVSGNISIMRNDALVNIDGFSNVTNITGRIRIRENHALTNLAGLSNLTNVDGELEINSNDGLENIDALAGLMGINGTIEINNNDGLSDINAFLGYTDIPGSLLIEANDGLTNIDVFSTLSELTGSVTISRNNALTNINGFSGLTDIVGTLDIIDNAVLSNIDGLSGLANLSGYLKIRENDSLQNIDGLSELSNITSTGRLDLTGNNGLINISGLSNLSSLEGGLYITGNDALTNVDGLSGLSLLNGGLFINNNNSLVDIDGLSGIADLMNGGNIEIQSNPALTNIDGLSGLVNVNGNIYIEENHALTNIDGLSGLTGISITSDIRILNNNALTNVNGLSNVTEILRRLSIIDNGALTNIDGLSGLHTIGTLGHLTIENNDALTNLDGLYGLEDVSGTVTVIGNALLSACCGLHDAIENADLEDFEIDTNLENCNSPSQILDACSLTLNYEQQRPCEGLDNGSINFFASDFDAMPFHYQWEELNLGLSGNGISDTDNFSIDNLGVGTYQVTVSLPNGAQEVINDILLDPVIGSVFEFTKLTTTNSTNGSLSGSLYLEYAGGTPPFELTWSGTASGIRIDIDDNFVTIFSLGPGEYNIQLTDANAQSILANFTLLDETEPFFPCSEPLDIVILNDVSGSVDSIEYSESKTFFVDFLAAINIGPGATESQASIIEWSTSGLQEVRIPLTGNMQELAAYENLARAFDGSTAIHQAMQFGAEYIEANGRANVEKVFVLSTDGTPSTSLISLADEFKANGYHIVTIAFDNAYSSSSVRDILSQVASIPLLAPGASAYSELDSDLADNIVNIYLCPLNPGSSSSVYFNRDAAIEINDVDGACPVPGLAEVTFTISALRELSIPAGTSVMFYHNNPTLFGATPILDFTIPCAIEVGSSETYTITLPINTATNLYALLNDDGNINPPLQFPITDLSEIAYANNIDSVNICVGSVPTLQALKYTSTPIPICDSIVMYTIDVCNIGPVDATDVVVNDVPPMGASLLGAISNTNGCSIDNGQSYTIPSGCCVSISLTYDVSDTPAGYYGIQDVEIDGPSGQEYINYDGSSSGAEDVTIGQGVVDCPSTNITFTKEVNEEEICEDGFLVYTYTIHNETNAVIHGARFIDILPAPMEWVYKPYFMNGLSINPLQLSGTVADFIIDEIPADTIATFQIDAYTADWQFDGMVSGNAILENVIDLENGGTQTIASNEVSTLVFVCDSIDTNTNDLIDEPLVSIIVFPNPSDGTIEIQNIDESVDYKLYSITGKQYDSGTYGGGKLELEFEGINLLELSKNGRVKTYKVIKVDSSR